MKALVYQKDNILPILSDYKKLKAISPNSVLVRMKAAALNHRDLWITKGLYPGIKSNVILGSDGCGMFGERLVIINPGFYWGKNENFQSQDFEVLGMPSHGTFAEEVYVDQKYIYNKPEHLSITEAAALPLAGVTAYRALITKANTQKGDKVFISGIGGGVSLMAFQFAIALGCEVYVSSSSNEKIEKAIALGAKAGVNYAEDGFSKKLLKLSGGIDVIIDGAGGDGFASLVYACNPGARMIFYGGTRGKINQLNPQIVFWRQIHILGTTMGSDTDFSNMLEFVNKHHVYPIVDSVYDLDNFQASFNKLNQGKQFGKIILNIF